MMKGAIISVIVVLAMVQLIVEPGQAAITCGQVDSSLAPCVPYLTGGSGPTPACCNGVKNITNMAQSSADKRTACNCCKEAANRYTNLQDGAAQALPAKCGVKMDIPISRTTNCDNVN